MGEKGKRRGAWKSRWCWAVPKVPWTIGTEPGDPHVGHRSPRDETAKGLLE